MTDAARSRYSPADPSDYTRRVGTVSQALDELAAKPSGGVTDHGALTGLGDDDHTQYLLGPVASYTTAGFVTVTDGTDRTIEQTGVSADSSGNLSTGGGDLTTNGGNVVTGPGLVDGRDVSVDGAKLDGIESGADVTDAANVNAAGAVMESDLGSGTGFMPYTAAFSTWSNARQMVGGTGINVTNGNGISGNPTFAVDGTVLVDGDFTANGVMVRSGGGSYTTRTLTGGDGITVGSGDGVLGNPSVTVDLSSAASLEFASGDLQLEGDSASPGNSRYYGTDGSGSKGWHALPSGGGAESIVLEWGDPTSTSASTYFIGRHGLTNPAGNNNAIARVPFAGTLTRVVLVADVTAVSGNPRLGAIVYRATSAGGSFGLLAFITTAGTQITATGSNQETNVTLSDAVSAGDYLSVAYLRSGGTSMTVNDLRVFMTIEA